MDGAPPPTRWAADHAPPTAGAADPVPNTHCSPPASADDAERAGRHARRAGDAGGAGGGGGDLYDALVHAGRETQYTLQPPGVREWRKEGRAGGRAVADGRAIGGEGRGRPGDPRARAQGRQRSPDAGAGRLDAQSARRPALNQRPPFSSRVPTSRRRPPRPHTPHLHPQWPALLNPVSPIAPSMPAAVTARYEACQAAALCGAFPAIRRAYAAVDASLFLWRYDVWGDAPVEYGGEDQAITAVGLAPARPGVFVDAVTHLLVVATTVEVTLVGVCADGGGRGELALQPLPGFSAATDGVALACVAATPGGRILAGGGDGRVYEVEYGAGGGGGWRRGRGARVALRPLTGGPASFLPSFAAALLHRAPPVTSIVVDAARGAAYALLPPSTVQVFDLGAGCSSPSPSKVAEIADVGAAAARAVGGRDVFGGGGDRRGAAVAALAVVPRSDSDRLPLVAVTVDGRRIYFSTGAAPPPSYGYYGAPAPRRARGAPAPRPTALRAEVVRAAPPRPARAAAPGGGRGLDASAALVAGGVLLLAEPAGPAAARSRLVAAARDAGALALSAAGAGAAPGGLCEAAAELETLLPGDACAIYSAGGDDGESGGGADADASPGDDPGAPPPRFIVVTTAGVVEVERRRPVDVLAHLLAEGGPPAPAGPGGLASLGVGLGARAPAPPRLDAFITAYGPVETAALCFALATAPPAGAPPTARAAAAAALAPGGRLATPPGVLDAPAGAPDGGVRGGSLAGGPGERGGAGTAAASSSLLHPHPQAFDMGGAVPLAAEPDWSPAHRGLCAYAARLLAPAWGARLLGTRGAPGLSPERAVALEGRLRALAAFAASRPRPGRPVGAAGEPAAKRARLEEAAAAEAARGGAVAALAARAADGLFLWRELSAAGVSRLAARAGGAVPGTLADARLRDWVASAAGDAAAAALVAALVSEAAGAGAAAADDVAARLSAGCPSYFRPGERAFHRAAAGLASAAAAEGPARAAAVADAVALLAAAPLAADLARILPQLAKLGAWEAAVQLAAAKAAALDPSGAAAAARAAGAAARAALASLCHAPLADLLRALEGDAKAGAVAGSTEDGPYARVAALAPTDRAAARHALLRAAATTADAALLDALVPVLVHARDADGLLAAGAGGEARVRAAARLPPRPPAPPGGGPPPPPPPPPPMDDDAVAAAELLARLATRRGDPAASAAVFEALAARPEPPRGGAPVTLASRADAIQCALLQYKAAGDADGADRAGVRLALLDAQGRAAEELTRRGKDADADVAATLQGQPLTLDALYNDVAIPRRLFRVAIELVALARHGDPAHARALWDVALTDAWDEGGVGGGGLAARGGAPAAAAAARRAALADAACDVAGRLPAGDPALPLAHVALRLAQAAAGAWPRPAPPAPPGSAFASSTLLAVARGSDGAAVDALTAALAARPGEPGGDDAAARATRLAALDALADVLGTRAARLAPSSSGPTHPPRGGGASSRREAGAAADAAERGAADARRLGGDDGGAVAARLDGLRARLEEAAAVAPEWVVA